MTLKIRDTIMHYAWAGSFEVFSWLHSNTTDLWQSTDSIHSVQYVYINLQEL
jgi:hypothetical protein